MSILSSIVSFIKRAPSTSKALAGFHKAIAQLDAVVEHHNLKADRLDAQIAVKVAEQTAAKDAAAEADKVAKRIRKIVA
ncbi:hypothetical protein CK228_13740 [Mesorhizobium sp. WSM4312]|uniref:hypothetical protein n=1 Tax=Mesorhizobium sp. WSM4312 TaxID=2029411 RepID=UPI000BB08D80|nr:hypothetical protein [Mesorhizobium sp. WSM4312]PBB68166.1 hypothetical protein CK228_13740 [Mesorhizobium sp. WSM4312]